MLGEMADAVLKGQTPKTNNTTDYDNGEKIVPSMLLESVIVDKTNYKKEVDAINSNPVLSPENEASLKKICSAFATSGSY